MVRGVLIAVFIQCAGLASLPTAVAAEPPDMANAHPSDESDPFPISVSVEPSLLVVVESNAGTAGRRVAISGRTISMGPGSVRPVRIAIDSDDGSVHTETDAVVMEDGSFSNQEFAPLAEGVYTITATAPDGRGTASAIVTAVNASGLGEHADKAMAEAIDSVEKSLDTVQRKLEEQMDTPAKAEAMEKLVAARKAHHAFRDTEPAAAIHGFLGAIYTHEALLEKQVPRLRESAGMVAELGAKTEQLKRMQSELGSADVRCEAMAMLLETVKLISTVIGFEAKLTTQLANMSKDVAADVASNRGKQAAGQAGGLAGGLLVKNGKKLVTAQKVIDGTKAANGLIADLAAFATEQVFDAYCKRYVGPIEGTFSGKFYRLWHGERVNWWKQSYKLSGRILLRYPKNATGDHIQMTGRIEGYAHSFDSWDDGMNAFDDNGIMKGSIVAALHYLPLDIKGESGARMMSQGGGPVSAQVWGSVAGMAFPNSFAMKVRGELNGDTISLLIGERLTDFTAKARVVNVIVSPLNTLGPTVVWYPLPFVDGHSVIAGAADDKPIDLKVTTQGKTMTAKGSVDHIEDTEHARGEYHLDLKLCNPGC